MRKRLVFPLVFGLASGSLLLTGQASAAEGDATVTLVHGVPGLTVDVYANGKELLADVKPGTVSKALTVPAGSYDLAVFPDGDGPDGTPALSKNDVAVTAGADATVAAYLTEAGKPALAVFANDTSDVAAGKARLTVRHAAAAPAVDVRAGGEVIFDGLDNGKQDSGEVPAGSVTADVVLAGTDTVAIGPADLELTEGTSTVVYAWGNKEAGYSLATQTVATKGSAPHGVNAGTTGLADPGTPTWALALAAVAGLGALAAGGFLAGTRRPQPTA